MGSSSFRFCGSRGVLDTANMNHTSEPDFHRSNIISTIVRKLNFPIATIHIKIPVNCFYARLLLCLFFFYRHFCMSSTSFVGVLAKSVRIFGGF